MMVPLCTVCGVCSGVKRLHVNDGAVVSFQLISLVLFLYCTTKHGIVISSYSCLCLSHPNSLEK